MRLTVAFCLLVVFCSASLEHKNLAGPPSDFGFHRIPDPANVPHISRSISKSIWFSDLNITNLDETKPIYETDLPVDGTRGVVLAFASPAYEQLRVELRDSEGNVVKGNVVSDYFHLGDQTTVPASTFLVQQPVLGTYTFQIYSRGLTRKTMRDLKSNPYADALLMLLVDNDVKITSHLLSYELKPGSKVGLVSQIVVDKGLEGDRNVVVSSASMMVTNPFGDVEVVDMNDDGLNGDQVPNDGKYTGAVIVQHSGPYLVEARLNGSIDDPVGIVETPFQRTTQHFLQVSDIIDLEIASKATVSLFDTKRYVLNVTVTGDKGLDSTRLRAYTEVQAVKKDHSVVPVCWLGGLVTINERSHTFQLVLDKRWLVDAGVTPDDHLFIQNTYLSDISTSFPITSVRSPIPVTFAPRGLLLDLWMVGRKEEGGRRKEEMREMRRGVMPESFRRYLARNRTADTPNLVLFPGYCADVNPWSRRTQDFTNGFYPVKYGNFPNDEYAHYLMDQITAKNIGKFGLIAHSQGGMVATHIHNYYWTGLEEATGGKLIQTLGTPFQGTSASGTMANLAKVFGIACGTNTDLSRDGAANWLSGIAMDVRQDVFSYGSTYGGGDHYFDYCSLAMNLILQWPNDGITEKDYSMLPGGNWEGFVNMWCHTIDMTYPPQYDDDSRNAILNMNAAR